MNAGNGEGKPCPDHVEQRELAVGAIGFLREADAIGGTE